MLSTLDSNALLEFGEFLMQAQGITLPENMSLLVTEPNCDDLTKNLMNSDAGLRLLAGSHDGVLVDGVEQPMEPDEAADNAKMLEGVDPAKILGVSSDSNHERVSVISSPRTRNFQ